MTSQTDQKTENSLTNEKCTNDASEAHKIEHKLNEYDFARLCFTDLNGAHMSKIVSCRKFAKKIANGHSQVYTGVFAFGPRNQNIEWDNEMYQNTINGRLIPDGVKSLRSAGWANVNSGRSASQSDSKKMITINEGNNTDYQRDQWKICEVICNIAWMNGVPVEAYPRIAVQRLIDALDKEFGLYIYSAFEPEFFVFNAEQDGTFNQCELRPAIDGEDMYKTSRARRMQRFFMELDEHLDGAGIAVQDYSVEYGYSQVEAPLMPQWGVDAADEFFTYKQAVKETAENHGMRASFMTQPGHSKTSSGTHYNFSVWHKANDATRQNAFQDNTASASEDTSFMSDTARHWIAGLLQHFGALCALFCPTTNCYRRLGSGFAPGWITWQFDSRYNALRVKRDNVGRGANIYMENRVPSGAVSPYLCMAAVLAAGLDGMRRKLTPPKESAREFGQLPGSLTEALDRLETDQSICSLLGREMVDYFIGIKRRCDIFEVNSRAVKTLNFDEKLKLELEHEKYLYFEYV